MLRIALILSVSLVGCSSGTDVPSLTLATTTSFRDSGLLDELLPDFEEREGIEVRVVAVGSGRAMELGRRGDADVLVVHSPAAEEAFVREGYGRDRQSLWYNDFVIVGPPDDPARLAKATDVVTALRTLADAEAAFVSRGDDSGTHARERALWEQAEVEPAGAWYVESGVGMAAALRIASERSAYTLVDRPTYLAQAEGLALAIHVAGDPLLRNPYSVILVEPSRHEGINADGARAFADYLASADVRVRVSEFGRDRFGQSLFFTADAD